MTSQKIAIHLLLQPESAALKIPDISREHIEEAVNRVGATATCCVHEMSVMSDHVHILAEVPNEEIGAKFISEAVRAVGEVLKNRDPLFELAEQVHLTLLPPWHIEILASFLRDQQRYHQTHSIADEIRTVFSPNFEMDDCSSYS